MKIDKSNFGVGYVGLEAMRTNLDDEEAEGMAGHGGYQDTSIERHDSEHDQVSQSCAKSVDACLSEGAYESLGAWFVFGRNRQDFNGNSEEEDEEEGQDVHGNAVIRPTTEEDGDVCGPCEARAHGTISCVLQVALGRRGSHRHASHVILVRHLSLLLCV
ncbi:unnamed protein product [Prunus brigantina]